jgi:hypothetical protein
MNIELIDGIAEGLTLNIGTTLLAAAFFFIACVFLFNIILNIEPVYGILLASVPFIVMVTSLSFYVSWGLGVAVLIFGLIMSIAMYRLFMR